MYHPVDPVLTFNLVFEFIEQQHKFYYSQVAIKEQKIICQQTKKVPKTGASQLLGLYINTFINELMLYILFNNLSLRSRSPSSASLAGGLGGLAGGINPLLRGNSGTGSGKGLFIQDTPKSSKVYILYFCNYLKINLNSVDFRILELP